MPADMHSVPCSTNVNAVKLKVTLDVSTAKSYLVNYATDCSAMSSCMLCASALASALQEQQPNVNEKLAEKLVNEDGTMSIWQNKAKMTNSERIESINPPCRSNQTSVSLRQCRLLGVNIDSY